MYEALILKSDVDRLYKERKELGGKGGMHVERCFGNEENNLGFYIVNPEENLIRRFAQLRESQY